MHQVAQQDCWWQLLFSKYLGISGTQIWEEVVPRKSTHQKNSILRCSQEDVPGIFQQHSVQVSFQCNRIYLPENIFVLCNLRCKVDTSKDSMPLLGAPCILFSMQHG